MIATPQLVAQAELNLCAKAMRKQNILFNKKKAKQPYRFATMASPSTSKPRNMAKTEGNHPPTRLGDAVNGVVA